MAASTPEPPLKRRKLSDPTHEPVLTSLLSYQPSNGPRPQTPDFDQSTESSSTFETSTDAASASHRFDLDIKKYIPAGCLRLYKKDVDLSLEIWNSQDQWSAFAFPNNVSSKNERPFQLNPSHKSIIESPGVREYAALLNAGLVRLEWRTQNSELGQIRVYILPDDIGRARIDRSNRKLRKSMKHLISQLDISKDTWNGQWSSSTPAAHIDSSLDNTESLKNEESLFHLFNALPSPVPKPALVNNSYASEAMQRILDNDVMGLRTPMYSYQRRTAAMMLQRETQPGQIVDPRLFQMVDQKGVIWYYDPESGASIREPRMYDAPRGGICAETMGLGKTLMCLSLILATRDFSSQIPTEYSVDMIPIRKTTGSLLDMAAAVIGRTGTPWKNFLADAEAQDMEFVQITEALRKEAGHYFLPRPESLRKSRHAILDPPRKIWLSTSTIVVVPANLIQQWCGEIRKHTNNLKVLVMRESKKNLPPVQELIDFDIILFSKQRFDKEAKDILELNGQPAMQKACTCPYVDELCTLRNCTCSKLNKSPLRDIHFKRLIVDEGHTLGNSSNSAQTEAFTVMNSLQVTSRWVVSGTPTQGLYGSETIANHNLGASISSIPAEINDEVSAGSSSSSTLSTKVQNRRKSKLENSYLQERNDLVKLGNIATYFLRARPWAFSADGDVAQWSHHVMQPRHGSKSRGNLACLRATLEGMIIRHRPSDVILDVELPPLHQRTVYLDGCMQNHLTLNTFNMMVITNAVTSERKDADYFFHPKQRKNLQALVSNLRQGSFFWSGFNVDHVRSTVETAKKFLEKGEIPISPEDASLLKQVIEFGEVIVFNGIYKQISQWHEMPMFIQNDCPENVREALSLDGKPENPTLVGATMLHDGQRFVHSQVGKENLLEGLVEAARKSHYTASQELNPPARPSASTPQQRANGLRRDIMPDLAGGVTIGDDTTPKKRPRPVVRHSEVPRQKAANIAPIPNFDPSLDMSLPQSASQPVSDLRTSKFETQLAESSTQQHEQQLLKIAVKSDSTKTLDPSSPLNTALLVSTASTKLSYLLDNILLHQNAEKILVFYESDNIAYYIAQTLECLNVKHLIYAKDLKSETRARYVVAFNNSETFRVLLMDVSQAAFGLDISSASRVYFVNPVFSPQVEAQAVKRAHRIGQTKPVHVETLVLRGSIEEVIVKHRQELTSEEHNRCKSILDDTTVYDWIRNIKFLPMPTADVPAAEQMAKLAVPQKVFGIGAGSLIKDDLGKALPNSDLK